MSTTSHKPSPAPQDCGEDVEKFAHDTQPRHIDSREEFCQWLETVVRDVTQIPAGRFSESSLARLHREVWEFAVKCAKRFCPECRIALGETAPLAVRPGSVAEKVGTPQEELLKRLRAAHALAAGPVVEPDANRLAKYLQNFTSRGHKAMITELWTKGYASFPRLANLRGKYGVTANADRNAIDRLVAKVESLWVRDHQVRVKKEESGLRFEKH
jgi:hypothetical protein